MQPAPCGSRKPSKLSDCSRPCLSSPSCRWCLDWCCTAGREPLSRTCARERPWRLRARMQIEEVKASIGREAGVSEWLAVTQDLINEFAALTGDPQWIHIDPERARRESPFGATVAHGFLT